MLAGALRSLTRLDVDRTTNWEVLVVDNASTDETPHVVAALQRDATLPLRYVCEPRQGVSHARNRGIQESTSPWLAFFADDQVADSHWLQSLLAMARDKQTRCVGGAVRLRPDSFEAEVVSPVYQRMLLQSGRGIRPYRFTLKRAPGTGNLLIHRSVFDQVGLFNSGLREASEDSELYARMHGAGIEGCYAPDAVVHHLVPSYRLTPRYQRWRSLRQGWSLARRDYDRWGWSGSVALAAARVAHALLVHAPQLLAALTTRRHDLALEMRCGFWKTEGYLRGVLRNAAPGVFPQNEFYAQLDFRSERTMFLGETS